MNMKGLLKAREPRTLFFRNLPPSSHVLDLGCGIGTNFHSLREIHPQCKVHGVDLLPAESVPPEMEYTRTDLESAILPFPDKHFDAVVCTHLLEHMRNPLCLGNEINRVLKPGGRLFVEAPNWTTLLVPSFGFKREQHGPFNFFDDPTHLKPWSRHGLYVLMTQICKLHVEKLGSGRLWWRIPVDLAIIVSAFITGNRAHLLAAFGNTFGWCIYGIGRKV